MLRKFSASLLSTAVLAGAIGFLWMGHLTSVQETPELTIRKIDIATTPPPPPPPKNSQQVEQTELTMKVSGEGAAMDISELSVEPELDIIKPDTIEISQNQTQWEMPEIDWDAYNLNDLDGKPALLTPIKVHFPKRLKRKGVTKVVVKLDVMIDEQGKVTLIDIVENPHHELDREIKRFVSASKFTAPFKENEPVRARFIWPVVIEA